MQDSFDPPYNWTDWEVPVSGVHHHQHRQPNYDLDKQTRESSKRFDRVVINSKDSEEVAGVRSHLPDDRELSCEGAEAFGEAAKVVGGVSSEVVFHILDHQWQHDEQVKDFWGVEQKAKLEEGDGRLWGRDAQQSEGEHPEGGEQVEAGGVERRQQEVQQ